MNQKVLKSVDISIVIEREVCFSHSRCSEWVSQPNWSGALLNREIIISREIIVHSRMWTSSICDYIKLIPIFVDTRQQLYSGVSIQGIRFTGYRGTCSSMFISMFVNDLTTNIAYFRRIFQMPPALTETIFVAHPAIIVSLGLKVWSWRVVATSPILQDVALTRSVVTLLVNFAPPTVWAFSTISIGKLLRTIAIELCFTSTHWNVWTDSSFEFFEGWWYLWMNKSFQVGGYVTRLGRSGCRRKGLQFRQHLLVDSWGLLSLCLKASASVNCEVTGADEFINGRNNFVSANFASVISASKLSQLRMDNRLRISGRSCASNILQARGMDGGSVIWPRIPKK